MNSQYIEEALEGNEDATSYTGSLTSDILELSKLVEKLQAENAALRAENERLKVVEEDADELYEQVYGRG